MIPAEVELRGTIRTMASDVRVLAEQRIKDIARLTAEAYGAVAEITYMPGYPVMVNSETQTEFAAKIRKMLQGTAQELKRGSEDFSYMLEERLGLTHRLVTVKERNGAYGTL